MHRHLTTFDFLFFLLAASHYPIDVEAALFEAGFRRDIARRLARIVAPLDACYSYDQIVDVAIEYALGWSDRPMRADRVPYPFALEGGEEGRWSRLSPPDDSSNSLQQRATSACSSSALLLGAPDSSSDH